MNSTVSIYDLIIQMNKFSFLIFISQRLPSLESGDIWSKALSLQILLTHVTLYSLLCRITSLLSIMSDKYS